VILPPGRLKLTTRPAWTGSTPIMDTIGIVVVAALAATAAAMLPGVAMTLTGRLMRSLGQPTVFAVRPAVLDRHVAALDVPSFTKPFAESGREFCVCFG
jgi:hypothetical protein